MNERARILIVDDDPKARQLLNLVFTKSGYETEAAATGEEALERARGRSFDVALLDIMLPDILGVDLLSPLTTMRPRMALVMITAHASTETAVQALNEGARAYIHKPLNVQDVLSTVREILDDQRRSREQQAMLEDLRSYARDLETENEALDAFAHTVAHDLKAPSYKISGYAETLLEDEVDPLPPDVQQECLRIMAQGARQVSTLVDELLLLAQVRSQDVESQPLAMDEIVARARRRLDFMIENQQAQLVAPQEWPIALGHAPWVEEVWVNYISNAVKYGGRPEQDLPPHIELGYTLPTSDPQGDSSHASSSSRPLHSPHSSNSCHSSIRDIRDTRDTLVVFWVEDNGPGLTPEEQQRLFTPFTRLAQVGTKGHGLGLSVVRRIVGKLGGDVGVESEKGHGCLFWFTLPRGDEGAL